MSSHPRHGRARLPNSIFARKFRVVVITALAVFLAGPAFAENDQSNPAEDEYISGTLTATIIDMPSNARIDYFVKSARGRRQITIDEVPGKWLGRKVRARGKGRGPGSVLEVPQGGLTLADSGDPAPAGLNPLVVNPTGEQRTLVLLATYADLAGQEPWSVTDAQAMVFGEVDGFIRENSDGEAWLTGEVHGWFTLSSQSTECSLSVAGVEADRLAQAAGVNLADFDRIIYLLPTAACALSGMGTLGDYPSRAYINGSFRMKTIVHELGHNFGLLHAHSLDCGATSEGASCKRVEYGDTLDTMGGYPGHYNVFHKETLGWLTPQIVSAAGTYMLSATEFGGSHPKALKIPAGTNPSNGQPLWYYLEYRQAQGYDAFLGDRSYRLWRQDVTHGIVVRKVEQDEPNSSDLLHMNIIPAYRDIYGSNDWFDPAMPIGNSYQGANGLQIDALSADGGTATIAVSFGVPTCTAQTPLLTVASPGGVSAAPGGSIGYELELHNRDAASCNSSVFDLSAALPGGWVAVIDPTVVSLEPGAQQSIAATVQIPVTESAATFTVQFNALDTTNDRTANANTSGIVTETAENQPPVANDDAGTTLQNTPVTIDVLSNDWDPENESLAVTGVSPGNRGSARVNADHSITYTPNARSKGQDTFNYQVSDGMNETTAMVSVIIQRDGNGNGNGKGKGDK